MSYPWINFKELRSRLTFERVLRHYQIEAKVKGERAMALCPLPGHPVRIDGKRTPSLSVNLARNIFRCFGCQASGNALEFAAMMEGFDPSDSKQFRAGALKVAEVFQIANSRPSDAVAKGTEHAKPFRKPEAWPSEPPIIINAPLDFELQELDPNHPYLRERRLAPQTLRTFGLGYCNRGLMKGRVVIPIHDPAGRLVGYAGRITKESLVREDCPKYLFPGDRGRAGKLYRFSKSLLLYNYHRIPKPVADLTVVEGFMSVFWLHQCHRPNVVAVMGSDCSEVQAKLIVELVRPDGRVWIMSDGNPAGEACAASILMRVSSHRLVRWARLSNNQQPTSFGPRELAPLLWPL